MRPLLRLLAAPSLIILLWPLALYPATLWLIARLRGRARGPAQSTGSLPSLTVVIPTYNEIGNIEARLQNVAACDYPREQLRVVVVDSASQDATADVAERCAARSDLHVRVLREERRAGKASAINFALQHCTTELVLVSDAPTRFDPAALEHVARVFDDPMVGAATGRFVVFEQQTATQREEALFWRIRNLLRNLEADVDSTPFLSGEFCCFRRRLIERLDADTIADDMNVALQVRRLGHRAVVEPQALFTEPRSPEVRDLLVRKVSRAAGGVQELMRHREMAFNRRYGLFGLLILPSDVLYYVPARLPAIGLVTAWLWPTLGRHKAALAAAALGVVAVPPVRRQITDAAYVALLNEWLFLRGWLTVLGGRAEVLWDQEPRAVVPGAAWHANSVERQGREAP